MNNNFNLNRIKWLLKADWIEHKKSFLLSMGVLFLIWLFFIFIVKATSNDISAQVFFFIVGGLITFTFYCKHVGRKIHKSANTYFTIPASSLEKYSTLLIEGAIYFATFLVLFYAGIFLGKFLKIPTLSVMTLQHVFSYNGSESGLYLLTALIFLSYITFRKNAFLIAIAGIAIYVSLLTGAIFKVITIVGENYKNYLESSFLYDSFELMRTIFTPLMLVSTLVVMYVGYLKLKEKELR